MRESTSLKLPDLEKGSSIFDYKVGKYIHCNLIDFPTQVNPHTGDWSHWNSLMENYVPPDIRFKIRKLLSFILSVVSPTNYGNILIPNVSSIRTDFLVDSCVR